METMTDFTFLGSKITADGDFSHEIKRRLLLGRKAMTNLDSIIKKQRHYFANKCLSSQRYGFSSSHVWMWELDYKESLLLLLLLLCRFSRVRLFATPWTAARQVSLSIIKHHQNSWSLLKLMSIESVMPFNCLILCHPLLLLPSIFPSIRVFSNDSVLHIRRPKYWSFNFSISPSSEYSGLISFRMDWLVTLQSKGLSRVLSNTTVQKHQFSGT